MFANKCRQMKVQSNGLKLESSDSFARNNKKNFSLDFD